MSAQSTPAISHTNPALDTNNVFTGTNSFTNSVFLTNLANGCLNISGGLIASTGLACGSGSGGGLADPGSNGLLKRTALNVTAIAAYTDIVGTWTSGGTCSSSTYLRGDGQCQTPPGGSGGLADPGSNGIVFRSALNVTNIATVSNVLGLFTGTCNSSTYTRGDGTCNTPTGTITTQALPQYKYINTGVGNAPLPDNGETYVTPAMNWLQTGFSTSLSAGVAGSLTLSPCPVGIDYTSGQGYQIWLADGANSEAVNVTSGSASGGNCTVNFTPNYAHPLASTYNAGSATSGVQETWNASCGTNASYTQNGQCKVNMLPTNYAQIGIGTPNVYVFYGTLFLHGYQSSLIGYGARINCWERGPCIQIGNRSNANQNSKITVQGISFRTDGGSSGYTNTAPFTGCNVTNTATTSGTETVTVDTTFAGTACGFLPGDMVTTLLTDDDRYVGDCVISSVSSTTFSCPGTGTIASVASPGVVALAFVAVLDNGNNAELEDLNYDLGGEVSHFNNFFDFWDDEATHVTNFANNGINLNRGLTWLGSFIFSGGAHVTQQIAPVINVDNAAITANGSACVTVYNGNGLYFDKSVCQADAPYEVYSSNTRGNYQGSSIANIYSECAVSNNTSTGTPYPSLGVGGAIFAESQVGARFNINGGTGMCGGFPSGGAGSTGFTYYIIVHSCPAGDNCVSSPALAQVSSPMQILSWSSTGSDSIPVKWPRIGNRTATITYDVLRSNTPPALGLCSVGGSGGTCGYVALGLSQSTACSGTLVCSYTDNGGTATTAYNFPINTGTYAGNLWFWPGALVYQGEGTVSYPVQVDVGQGPAVGVGLGGSPLQASRTCNGDDSTGGSEICYNGLAANGLSKQYALKLMDGWSNDVLSNVAGRLIFSTSYVPDGNDSLAIYPHQWITLQDSNPPLTQVTSGGRRPASQYDVFIATDSPVSNNSFPSGQLTTGQLAFGAPVAISNYINDASLSNTTWLERLTASGKVFKTGVTINSGFNLTLANLSNGCMQVASGVVTSTGTACPTGSSSGVSVNGGSALTGTANLQNGTSGNAVSFSNPSGSNIQATLQSASVTNAMLANPSFTFTATSPITGSATVALGGTLTAGCASCVTAVSPGIGLAHFGGSSNAVTSSAVNLASADVTGILASANGGMVYPGSGIPNSTGTVWGTSYGAQGTDTNLLTAGTVSATAGLTLCTDTNAGATTSGCTGGSGGVSTVSVVTANGVSGSVANPTTTPAITLTLGAITPTSVNNSTIGNSTASTGAFTSLSSSGILSNSQAGAASASAVTFTGAPYTAGSTTTNFPLVYLNDGTGPTTFSTAGTEFGINAPTGFTGNFLDFHVNGGASLGKLDYSGNLTVANNGVVSGGNVTIGATNGAVTSGNGTMTVTATSGNLSLAASGGNGEVVINGNIGTGAGPSVKISNGSNFLDTSGNPKQLQILSTFAPSSGSAAFISTSIEPTINQTGTSSGAYYGLLIAATETSLKNATNYLIYGEAGSSAATQEFYVTNAGVVGAAGGQMNLSIPAGTATYAAGSGVTSVVCATGYSCNNTRGTLTIVGGTGTTGTIATVSFSAALNAAPACFAYMNGGATVFGIGNSAPTTTAFNITAGVSVIGATFNVNYTCQP